MAFEVSDLPGQPLLCCNRTLADHCVAFVPLVDRLFTSCTVVQEVDPFAAFRKNTVAPLIFLLQNPGWVLWVGLCITWRVLGVGADAAAGREWKWQSFLRPTLFVEAQLQARAPSPPAHAARSAVLTRARAAQTLLLLWLAACPQVVLQILGFFMLLFTALVETRKAMSLMRRNEAIMREAGMEIRPNESQAETAARVHAESLRLRKLNAKARAKKEAKMQARANAKAGGISAKKARALAR
jgi:hypothetical protein